MPGEHSTLPQTHSERALREALGRARPYVANVVEAHGFLTNKRDLEAIDAALSLPHLPATDEGEAKAIFLAAHADGWRGNQLRRDVQHVDAEKSWELFVSHGALGKILSAPTSQPPAAETRLREALGKAWTNFLDANPDDLNSPEDLPDHALMTGEQFEDWAMEAIASAALTQPEPVDRKWFPHLDFRGDPMREGCFREPYPMAEEMTQPEPTAQQGGEEA